MSSTLHVDGDEQDPELVHWLAVLRERFRRDHEFDVEALFVAFPGAKACPASAVELIYEDYCLRRDSGIEVSASEYQRRYRQWDSKLAVVFECDQVLNQPPETSFPKPGDRFGEFDLHRELGRGATGRVYLATQPMLSDRPVVLKVSSQSGCEHLSLARLQHTSIVPLLFAQDDAGQAMRVLCMPYLGECTLEDAMHSMATIEPDARAGSDIARAIEQRHRVLADRPNESRQELPAMRFLKSVSYEKAVCWIISCLADGLHYAHQRGLVHFDVKPSNVLMANDGQPMMLDFHLARDSGQLVGGSIDALGGTPGYMSPEHRIAIDQIRKGSIAATSLDQRSDIYSLGLVMHDLLSGVTPPSVQTHDESPGRGEFSIGRLSKLGSREVVSILSTALEDDPNQRFSDAGEFGAALRRVALGRRKDRSIRPLLLGIVVGAAVTSAAFFALRDSGNQAERVGPVTTIGPVTTNRIRESAAPRVADELHMMLANVRSSEILETGNEQELRRLKDTCQRLWRQRNQLVTGMQSQEGSAGVERLRNDMHDLATLYRRLLVQLAADDERARAEQLADQILAESLRESGSK